ncbi:hypothetical protein POF50_024340 [Streptomyces sp. SL13]|uniref:Uncharacterized protein n=1 Tax=Streptantibioticus silvisoli TaxID=2705255 RepID=A0AA90H7J6_9ACTN|nr:hypothetical protein [Streptantibioticus silvisoli]MDI5962164.1 hypothetical protein [Streptantibioticus silvisoli]MDI5972430.1 hypothetical protein [Streptantibioticus silvisoli]
MLKTAGGESPIYDMLVAELGDIPADTRRTAEQARRTAAAAVGSLATAGAEDGADQAMPR